MLAADPVPPIPTPVDTLIDLLTRDRVNARDRCRIGEVLEGANARASGHHARPDEAFSRVTGPMRPAGGIRVP